VSVEMSTKVLWILALVIGAPIALAVMAIIFFVAIAYLSGFLGL
jgi:hypothetical protein